MIHQYIFAGPKPGLSVEAFQQYWVNFHAPDYAAKIPQIRRYLVAPRLHLDEPHPVPFFEGVAEIWLKDAADQLASLKSPEFLQGARADEPRWAAFWQTFLHESFEDDVPPRARPPYFKFYTFLKRRFGTPLEGFIEKMNNQPAESLPGMQHRLLSIARSDGYGFGEPRFDAIEVWSFNTVDDLSNALQGEAMRRIEEGWRSEVEDRYLFSFCGQENWIIY